MKERGFDTPVCRNAAEQRLRCFSNRISSPENPNLTSHENSTSQIGSHHMSHLIKQIIAKSRPTGFRGRGDKYLADIAADLHRLLLKTQGQYAHDTLVLDGAGAAELAAILTEFAEDMHADLGLWRSIESANQQWFGTPLPFLVEVGDTAPGLTTFDRRRVQHLLGTFFPWLIEDLLIASTHQDVRLLADVVSVYLTERFAKMPTDSGVKQFLSTDNRYGWDVKRKLLWLGRQSYLFRHFFADYLSEQADEENEIAGTDDFVCQQCTEWSGMGVIDVLAGALDLPEEDRATLRTWYERHAAYYRIISLQKVGNEVETLVARNIVNGEDYTIRLMTCLSPFVPGMVVFGSLTPWRGEWYWSGGQQTFRSVGEEMDAVIRLDMLQKSAKIAYRYCLPQVEKARELATHHHEQFVAHYGSDFIVFPDGLSAAAAEKKRLLAQWDAADPEKVAKALKAGNLTEPFVNFSYPPEILNHENGIGIFSTPIEGIELARDFVTVISGLQKKGIALTWAETDALCGFVTDYVCSPAFVQRLTAEHGAESIGAVFFQKKYPADFTLQVLLRRYKGAHFRRRYPAISLMGEGV